MSNEVSVQDKLAAVYKRMLTTIIFLVLGWAVLWLGAVTLGGSLVMFLSFFIAPAPMLVRFWLGGFGAMFNLPEYNVVTTYADGRKESDGGVQSAQVNFIIRGIFLVIMLIIGFVATAVYLIFLFIKYIVLYTQAKPKPAFIRSAFFLIIIAVLSLPGILMLSAVGRNAIQRSNVAAFRAEHSEFFSAVENAERENVTAYILPSGRHSHTVIMTIWDDDENYVDSKYLPRGEMVTIVGSAGGGADWGTRNEASFNVPVLYEGVKGYISIKDLSLTDPNQ